MTNSKAAKLENYGAVPPNAGYHTGSLGGAQNAAINTLEKAPESVLQLSSAVSSWIADLECVSRNISDKLYGCSPENAANEAPAPQNVQQILERCSYRLEVLAQYLNRINNGLGS